MFRDIKFGPIAGNTGGWNVISSTETSDDGKARTDKMLATTEGVTAVDGGKKAFLGKNEELKTERFDGDANNFTYSTGESSNMLLNENIVTGDDNNKRIESKSSSVSHTSNVVRSSTNTGSSDGMIHDADFQNQLMRENESRNSTLHNATSATHSSSTEQQKSTKTSSSDQQKVESRSENVKLSQDPATVKEAFRLAEQAGNILSRHVERYNPTTNMITEKKELANGTIVTTKRYETINADHVDIQATTRDNRSSANAHDVKKVSQNTETKFKTSRDQEAFLLSQQPGTVISREVEITDPTTKLIIEKKKLADGTIVTTRQYEKLGATSDHSSNVSRDTQSAKSFSNDTKSTTEEVRKTSTNETFKTTRDEEALRLAQQPGKVISHDVEMTNPTTRMITEKKELADGTIVTTKRYESINNETQSNKSFTKEQHNIDSSSKNLRNDSTRDSTVRSDTKTQNLTFKTARDEEAFRLSQQPGTVISRNVEMTNPTTRMITEKKELTDGTIVTTKRYETVSNEAQNVKQTVNNSNVEVKRTVTDNNSEVKRSTYDNNSEVKRSTYDNNADQNVLREAVEETITKKLYDTSCQCPEKHDSKTHARDFINKERSEDFYDITSQIVSDDQVHKKNQTFTDTERNREDTVKREETRRLEQKRVDDQMRRDRLEQTNRKITRELEVDSAHRAFASSLRCVTPPNERVSAQNISRNDSRANRSPSRETTTSKISSSTTTIKKASNTDIRKSEDRRSTSKSPEKPSKKITPDLRKSTTEIFETIDVTKNRSVSPQKITQRTSSPTKGESPQKAQPKKPLQDSRDSSPHKQNGKPETPRESSPSKSYRASSPQKSSPASGTTTPRATSPQKYPSGKTTTRDVSPNKSAAKPTKCDEREILTSTIIVDNKEKRDELKIVHTIDTKNLSATTSVSDIEYIIPDRRPLLTDLDSEDIQIQINLQHFKDMEDLEIKTTVSEINDDFSPASKKPFQRNRSETFEERARKLIGVAPNDTKDDELPHYAKPTYASFPNGSNNRVSEIRERKAKIEEIEQTVTKKKTIKSDIEDFITREKNESRRSTQVTSSPDTSPTRKPSVKKPSESTKPYERPNENSEVINTNVTKTVKTTETRAQSPEKKKPTTVETNKKLTTEQAVKKTPTTDRSPIRHTSPETHITIAKIHISPTRGVKHQPSKPLKVAPSIRLVKKPLTDISSTEPDSDVETETDQELIKNIDKGTAKSTRKKLLQSRKDSAPVPKTSNIEKEKVSRSVSESVFKTKKTSKDISQSKESSPKKDTKRPTKCVTTKTINLTNVSTINSNTLDDVVIDVQQAKSSREPSPNKIIPIPVRGDEDMNGHQVIYPDKVTEPDDVKRPKSKVTNIPIFEEKTKQFVGLEITEVETDRSQIILEEDEHETTIINSSTLERDDRKRNSIQIDPIDDEDDDHAHLMSVSQKVNKFISTAEELKKPRTSTPFQADDVQLEDISEPEDDSMLTVNRKVTKFSTTSDETLTHEKKFKIDDMMNRSFDDIDENLKNDECLLSVSDKVNKFISSAEKLTKSAPQKSPELVKNIMKSTTKASRNETEDDNESFLTREKISTLTRDDRSDSKSTLKSASSDITLKSTEAIKRARAVFENNTASRDIKRHDDIMSRPSVWEAKRTPTAQRKVFKETVTTRTPSVHEKSPSIERQSPVKDFGSNSPSPTGRRSSSSDRTPAYMRDQVSTKKDLFERKISSSKLENEMSHQKSLSPQISVEEKNRSGSEEVHQITRKISSDKHYMSHTVASLEHVTNERRDLEISRTSHRESRSGSRRESDSKSPTKFHRNTSESTNDSMAFEPPRSPTKFGVELKRTDSGRNVQTRRVSSGGGDQMNIEEIFDLAELEKLLEVVVGYEQRRRIRAQIRVVRKEISERKASVEAKTTRIERTTNYSSPTRKSRDESSTQSKVTQRIVVEKPDKLTRDDSRVQKVVTTTTTKTTTAKQSSSEKPREITQTRTTRVTSGPTANSSSPRNIIENLNKDSKSKPIESVVKIAKKTAATSNTQRTSSTRDSRVDSTDCVTSSYGIGPTDSNGLPLFGLKALRKKAPTTKETKSKKFFLTKVAF